MTAKVTFFPVGNGDMTLIELADNATKILIDVNITGSADDPDVDTFDAAGSLRSKLNRDERGRPYVDAFLLSHPDQDHCDGLQEHFYLGDLKDYSDDSKVDAEKKIVIREVWSSPIVFRRASKDHSLCADAAAFNTEAKRRVKVNRDKKFVGVTAGNRILILGEDEDGKTDDLTQILIQVDDSFNTIDGKSNDCIDVRLLAPRPQQDRETEKTLSKNRSSTILNLTIAADCDGSDGCKFLSGGDAEVAIWERLWQKHKGQPAVLEYDLLQAPHHCSWHSLSYDSWSEKSKTAKVSKDARSALSRTRVGAVIVASSDPILDNDNDPPCHGAKLEYVDIADSAEGTFYCTGEYPSSSATEPLEFTITKHGPQLEARSQRPRKAAGLLRPAAVVPDLGFPNKAIMPNKPQGFA